MLFHNETGVYSLIPSPHSSWWLSWVFWHSSVLAWQPTPVFLPGESQGRGSLVGCCLWGRRVGHDWSDLAAAAAVLGNLSDFNIALWLMNMRAYIHCLFKWLFQFLSRYCFPPECCSLRFWITHFGSLISANCESGDINTVHVCACLVTQSCPALCNPMDCSPSGSFVHGILQAGILLKGVAIPFSRGSSQPRD